MINLDAIGFSLMLIILTFLLISVLWIVVKSSSKEKVSFSSRTKIPGLDLFRYRTYFFEIGLILACGVTYLFFEWMVYPAHIAKGEIFDYLDDLADVEVIRTAHNNSSRELVKPVQRPRENIIIEEIAGGEIVEYIKELIDQEVSIPVSANQGNKMELPAPPPIPVFKEPDVPVIIAEQMPRFPGCEEVHLTDKERKVCSETRLLQYLYNNIKYPVWARENGINGMVVIQFVVGKDGVIRDATIVRDIGGGCGKEALRVVELMRQNQIKWTPGRQGGRTVSVRFSLPIKFQLQ